MFFIFLLFHIIKSFWSFAEHHTLFWELEKSSEYNKVRILPETIE